MWWYLNPLSRQRVSYLRNLSLTNEGRGGEQKGIRREKKKSFAGKEKDGQTGGANTLQCNSRACLNDYRLVEGKCLLSAILISVVFFKDIVTL